MPIGTEPKTDDTPQPLPRKSRPSWRRALGAQESGLILVIAAMMIALTLGGGTKPMRTGIGLAGGDSFTATLLPGASETYNVEVSRAGGATESHRSSSRPREGDVAADGSRTLFVTHEVNAFLDPANLVLVAKDASFIAVIAVGMTAVIILGGIDLSVGSIYALAAIVGAVVLKSMHTGLHPPANQPLSGWMPSASVWVAVPVAVGACVLAGGLCGLANGSMVVGLRVHPFVITLGMMAALRGVTILIPKEALGEQSVGGFPPSFQDGFFRADIGGVQPVPIFFMLLVAAVGWFVLTRTVFGRRVYAIGGNETAARYAGVPVGAVKILVYTIVGALAGLSGSMYIGYFGAAETGAGGGYELQVIAATVIGGASLSGGRGTAIGAILGAILVRLIDSGMVILKIPQDYNQIVMGAAIIIAVVVDQAKSGLSKGTRR